MKTRGQNKTVRTQIRRIEPFVTLDKSEIRELLSPRNSVIRNQSLAEARIKPGRSTLRHHHKRTEEIYYVTSGKGCMELGKKILDVKEGDAIAIPPRTWHRITNTGKKDLKILCCCAPSYEHRDTVMREEK